MRRHLGLLACILSAMWSPGHAQDAAIDKKTVIDLDFDPVMDRARPNPMSNLQAHFHIRVELSGKNQISQAEDLSSNGLSQENKTEQSLGQGSRSGTWHVASKNRLVRIWNMPQSIRTITVTLDPDKTCRLDVKDQLKPGFREYAFSARWTNGLEYYSRYENHNMSCKIQ